MITAQEFLAAGREQGLTFFSGTPCSYLRPLINAVINDPSLTFRDATNEGDAVAMAAGAFVGSGRPGVVMFQNSGLGNAVNALTSLNYPFRIPTLLIVTHRGQPGGPADEPQHELMGQITTELLDTLRIKWENFPRIPAEVASVFARAMTHFATASLPYALVMPQGVIAETPLLATPNGSAVGQRTLAFSEELPLPYQKRATRTSAIETLIKLKTEDDLVVATTGYSGRELYTLKDADTHFYMVGSMGSASSFALGLALLQPQRKVWVIDGDGAVLMRMGNLASVGAHRPRNLCHLVLDNEAHDSTGGQATVSRGISFGAIAQACGYARAIGTDSLVELDRVLRQHSCDSGPTLIHFRIRTGTSSELGRPKFSPLEVRKRLMKVLRVG